VDPIQEAESQRRAIVTHELLGGHEFRIARLEGQMAEVKVSLVSLEHRLNELNKTLQDIKVNTEEFVTVAKSLKLIGSVVAWGGGMTTLLLGIYALLTLKV
jgi:hypothetical protein